MKIWIPLLSLGLLTGIAACKKNAASPIPEITFLGLAPDTVHATSAKDTAFLAFGFADGDGDLGNDGATGQYDIYLQDSRYPDTSVVQVGRYLFPPIPDDARDPINGLKGQGVIALRAVYIAPRPDTLHVRHGDTLTYQMWVIDQAGHKSNVITTTPLYIIP